MRCRPYDCTTTLDSRVRENDRKREGLAGFRPRTARGRCGVSGPGRSHARRRRDMAPEAGAATTTRFFTSFRMTARERLRGVSGPGREHPVFFK